MNADEIAKRIAETAVRSPSGCLIWAGRVTTHGYPVEGETLIHRHVLAQRLGQMPEGRLVKHHCGIRRCVEGAHLYVMPGRDDVAEMVRLKTVRAANGCLLWTGALNSYGYARYGTDGDGVHRRVWEAENGPVPEGMLIRHVCDTPACVELSHLLVGTPLDNMRDRSERRRAPLGEATHNAKLTEEKVREIRALYASGVTQTELARRFRVRQGTISGVVLRKAWRHVA